MATFVLADNTFGLCNWRPNNNLYIIMVEGSLLDNFIVRNLSCQCQGDGSVGKIGFLPSESRRKAFIISRLQEQLRNLYIVHTLFEQQRHTQVSMLRIYASLLVPLSGWKPPYIRVRNSSRQVKEKSTHGGGSSP